MPNEPPTLPVSTCTLSRRHAEDIDELALHAERALAADVHRVAAARLVERRDRRARLHRVDDDAAVDQRQPGDVRGSGKRLRDFRGIAVEIVERDVARHVVVELRRAGRRGLARLGDGGQRLDVDLDRFRRILGLRQRLGDHDGDRIADEAHLVGRAATGASASSSREPSRFLNGTAHLSVP